MTMRRFALMLPLLLLAAFAVSDARDAHAPRAPLTVALRFAPACDSLGCADAYRVEWVVDRVPVRDTITRVTRDSLRVASPTADAARTVCANVTAIRRDTASAVTGVCETYAVPSTPPPAVQEVRLDTVTLAAPAPTPAPSPTPTPAPHDTGAVRPFFADNFDSGAMSPATDEFAWGHMNRTRVDSAQAHSGKYSLRFRYPGSEPGGDAMAEQRFRFLRDHRELWFEWYVRIPDNYVLRQESPSNNKFLAVWANAYDGWADAQVTHEIQRATNDSGTCKTQGAGSWDSAIGTMFDTSLRGRWVRMRHHMRVASDLTARDGVYEVWRDTTKVCSYVGPLGKEGGNNYWRNGYLLGWANTGYTEDTHFFVDDVQWFDRDPGWSGTISGATTPRISTASADVSERESAATLVHEYDGVSDVFVSLLVQGVPAGTDLTVLVGGVRASRVAAIAPGGKSMAIFWYRVPAAQLAGQHGAVSITSSSTRATQLHAVNVADVGSVEALGARDTSARGGFALPALPARANDVLLSSFVSIFDAPLTATAPARLLAATVQDSAPTRPGQLTRRLVMVEEAATATRGSAVTIHSDSARIVAGIALRITGVTRRP